ncbi:MAG TPA: isoamylase early set domain-containing protein [Longimicrobiales bacterium]|nr:isoamylase early set domain-containing protein [Longimicrobiales bacterium]
MHPDVHRYLDGELPRTALSADALAELAAWERLERDLSGHRAERAPAWLEASVMRDIAAAASAAGTAGRSADAGTTTPAHAPSHLASEHQGSLKASVGNGTPWWERAVQWLLTPRPLQVRPLAPLAAAAALALVIGLQATSGTDQPLATGLDGEAVIYVQFTLDAGNAQSVSVAGDFNDWSVESGALRDVDGSGVFRGLIAVTPGVHKYMFVVDGEEWVTDPAAERHIDDGFGMRNALLAVALPDGAL